MPDPTTVITSTAFWIVIGQAIGATVGIIALVTAVIELRTARLGRRGTVATPAAVERASEPKVLLPTRSHFVNRDEEMRDAVARICGGEKVLSIEGGVGIGKSATATELAHRLLDVDGKSDGVPDLRGYTFVWIDGQDGCPSLARICSELSLLTDDQSLSSVADDEKLSALRAHLARNRTVLLLDNLRLSADVRSRPVRELLQTMPAGSLVITSVNRPGTVDASRVVLEDLKPPHVIELIQHVVHRLGFADAQLFDEAFATRLHAAVGGNPRMIEWFLRALSKSPEPLEERFAAVECGEGLRELFLPVWEELAEQSRVVLAACAYLRGHALAEQMAIACGLGDNEVFSVLEELIGAGFVTIVRGTGRPDLYTCAHGVQRFALAEEAANLSTFTTRLAAHYIRYLATYPEDARTAIPHIASILVVLEELFVHEDDHEVQALFVAVLDILFTLGLFDDRIAAGEIAYQSAMRVDNYRGASLACEVLSSTHAVRGEIGQARAALALGLHAAECSGDRGETARQMRCRGFVSYRAGEPEEALAAAEGADRLARETGEFEILANVLGLRAAAYWHLGALDASEAAAQSCLQVCQQMPWERAVAYPLRDLAEIAIHRREFQKAENLLDRARNIVVEYGDQRQLARVHLTEARLRLIAGELRAVKHVASLAESEAMKLGLPAEAQEARALRTAARRARVLLPLRLYYAWCRPTRLTEAPVGGD
jgi:tetratricopeptide (TPR) repeat protein